MTRLKLLNAMDGGGTEGACHADESKTASDVDQLALIQPFCGEGSFLVNHDASFYSIYHAPGPACAFVLFLT